MVIYSGIVKVSSLFVNLICSFIVPIVESIAYVIRIGGDCECPSPLCLSPVERGRRHKKLKNSTECSAGSSSHHNDVKKIKLLLDITVAQNGSQVLDIQASAAKGHHDEGSKDKKAEQQHCQKNPGLILWLLNMPSSVMMWFVHNIKKWAHDLDALKNPPSESNRIKKSPKRRITRNNYRRIIPFFPYNLLGFSNYTAFQMPTITRSSSSSTSTGAVGEETNNLNVSVNGKARCKRRRNSSTEDSCSSLSDDDISYLEHPEKSHSSSAHPPSNSGGHDEVDSDETADTITKRMVSSSSSNENSSHPQNHHDIKNIGKKIIVALNTSTSEDNGAGGNVTTMTDLDSSRDGVVGEEHQVRFSFIEELNEAANESYNSKEDPDYVPPENVTSTSDSSFATDKGCSDADESFLRENGFIPNGKEDDDKIVNEEDKSNVVEKPEAEKLEPVVSQNTNGSTPKVASPVASPTAVTVESSSAPNSSNKKKNKKQNKKQNVNNTNNHRSSPVPPGDLEPFSTGFEDDYKTPEEGEHEGYHQF